MWLLFWIRQDMPLWVVFTAATLAGVFFGLSMAAYFRYVARKHNLPSWVAYTSQ